MPIVSRAIFQQSSKLNFLYKYSKKQLEIARGQSFHD